MNLITYLIENKLAKNQPHANAKIALLHLQDICNDEAAVIARVKLYEAHKASRCTARTTGRYVLKWQSRGYPCRSPWSPCLLELNRITMAFVSASRQCHGQ